MINYKINLLRQKQIFDVTLEFISNDTECYLKLPTWIPGSYMIREFSKNIITIKSNNPKHVIEQIDKNTWVLSNIHSLEQVAINYQVFANDLGIRMAYLDNYHAFINGTSLFIYPNNMLDCNYLVMFDNLSAKDMVATSLEFRDGVYLADNYYQLIDNPIKIGNILIFDFMVYGIPHKIALSGIISNNIIIDKLITDITKICQKQIDIFGSTPFTSYLFSLTLQGSIYTGIEHLSSTTLMAPFYSLPTSNQNNHKEYIKLLTLISHEYFHAWNVKSIKPDEFNRYDLNRENYTDLLWFFEGLTSYYDEYILYLCGIITKIEYLDMVLENINSIYKYNGVNQQTLTNSSITAWVKYYKRDENSINAITSYYSLGALFNLCIDLYLRIKSNSLVSFNNVLEYMWHNRIDNTYIINRDNIFDIIYQATNIDCTIFKQYLYSNTKLPIEELFDKVGIDLIKVNSNNDTQGAIIDNLDKASLEQNIIDLGCKLDKQQLGYKVINVYDNSLAKKYGIIPNDIILAIDGIIVDDIKLQLNLYTIGQDVSITLIRHNRLIVLDKIKIEYLAPHLLYYLLIKDNNKLSLWI